MTPGGLVHTEATSATVLTAATRQLDRRPMTTLSVRISTLDRFGACKTAANRTGEERSAWRSVMKKVGT